jgi:hypothetical protein
MDESPANLTIENGSPQKSTLRFSPCSVGEVTSGWVVGGLEPRDWLLIEQGKRAYCYPGRKSTGKYLVEAADSKSNILTLRRQF